MPVEYIPNRGDLVWLDFVPQAGHEQSGRRPALVLSPSIYNRKTGLALFCPVTTQQKGYPFEVPLGADSPVAGVVLADQIKSLDWRARNASLAGRASHFIQRNVIQRIGELLTGQGK